MLPMQGAQVRSLVMELGSHTPCGSQKMKWWERMAHAHTNGKRAWAATLMSDKMDVTRDTEGRDPHDGINAEQEDATRINVLAPGVGSQPDTTEGSTSPLTRGGSTGVPRQSSVVKLEKISKDVDNLEDATSQTSWQVGTAMQRQDTRRLKASGMCFHKTPSCVRSLKRIEAEQSMPSYHRRVQLKLATERNWTRWGILRCLKSNNPFLKNLWLSQKMMRKNIKFWLFILGGRKIHRTCGILVLWSGIEPTAPELWAWSLNHWATREIPDYYFIYITKLKWLGRDKWAVLSYFGKSFQSMLVMWWQVTRNGDIFGLRLTMKHGLWCYGSSPARLEMTTNASHANMEPLGLVPNLHLFPKANKSIR